MVSLDYTVGAFIVKDNTVLLIRHKKLNTWLCPGGHIEPNEDPETAVFREIKEEVGLDIELVGDRVNIKDERSKALVQPRFLDLHPITDDHKHVGIFYIARPKTTDVSGEYGDAGAYGWFDMDQMLKLNMWPATRQYAFIALYELGYNAKKLRPLRAGVD